MEEMDRNLKQNRDDHVKRKLQLIQMAEKENKRQEEVREKKIKNFALLEEQR